ncbi:MAG TPA: transcriptional regulator [Rhizomicrobium sp.]|jgi:DNA-binding MarR family transcriptional regulator
MEQPDEIIHQPVRLRIMAALHALPHPAEAEFVTLAALLKTTNGNLGAHIGMLEAARYVTVTKDFVGRKPRTRVRMTRAGRHAFEKYVGYLQDLVDSAGLSKGARR